MQIKDVLAFIESEASNPLVVTTAGEVASMLGLGNPTPAIHALVTAVQAVQVAATAVQAATAQETK